LRDPIPKKAHFLLLHSKIQSVNDGKKTLFGMMVVLSSGVFVPVSRGEAVLWSGFPENETILRVLEGSSRLRCWRRGGGAVSTVWKKGGPEGTSSPDTQLSFREQQKLKSMEGVVAS
jgi:hypothetical protein